MTGLFADDGPGDHGVSFDYPLGVIEPGESVDFELYAKTPAAKATRDFWKDYCP
jgi:hypothetical protein